MGSVAQLPRTQAERTEAAKHRVRIAALELFGRNGYEQTSLAEISLHAGFSRALAQYHYADKSLLAIELLEDRMQRDLHLQMLECPAAATGEDAWRLLMAHLDSVAEHYGQLHGGTQQSAVVRGEMALHNAARMSTDPALKEKVGELTRDLISRVEHVLAVCRRSGAIDADVDVHSMAVLYVHAIWGLAVALFANPKGGRQIARSYRQIGVLLQGLRTDKRRRE